MGTAHGAEELGLYSHELAWQAGQNQKCSGRQKYSSRPIITLFNDGILINRFLHIKRETLQMRIAVSRE
jgi:hypothetical protein